MMSASDDIFFWGHGSPSGFWTYSYETIFTIDHMSSLDFLAHLPTIIAFNPCYAGVLDARSPCLATEFTRNGASAYVANTAGWGYTETFKSEFLGGLESGTRIGPSLFAAMRESITKWPHSASSVSAASETVLHGPSAASAVSRS